MIEPSEEPSKSRVKRDHLALQDLAERLVALPRTELERLSLGEATWAAIDETSRIKDLRALRRHYKRIAKLLAREDTDAVQALTTERAQTERRASAEQHRIERWRERLMDEGGDALTAFLDARPRTDAQQLRHLIRAARRDREQAKTDGPRKLFRFLREALSEGPDGAGMVVGVDADASERTDGLVDRREE